MATILVVEDNRTILENTSELLEMEGYSVITASNGKDGFEKILKSLPDLIVCDIWMPEMDGFELLEKLGTYADLKNIPLIFFSARSEKKDIKKGLELGAYDFIVKPSDLSDLLISIKNCLLSKKLI
ncbi:response regulator transcription factor [Arenibacter echinorum]|uniref:Response regulator receiver domain-containing protein n=1 Tax=Arenibacter echinorum TaxID=440515 RepID=A0A327R4H3_9FLAO|nr:response regulator [Arenibacter echinorum]RAJ11670.1 response regulator receiver domain-containing protein [Arenibacter echinorum]